MRYIIFLFCFGFVGFLPGQTNFAGNFPVLNYTKKQYKGGTQNWDAQQAPSGLMYFANSEGLLEFDGVRWAKYPLPNQTIMRSVAVAKEKIYVGGQGEFGWFEKNERGVLTYNSLTEKVPEAYRNFNDVWHILATEDQILFLTNRLLYQYKNESFQVFDTGGPVHHLGMINGNIYVHDGYKGLLKFENDKFILSDFSGKPPSPVSAFLPYRGDTVVIATNKNGLFLFDEKTFTPFPNENDLRFKNNSISSAIQLPGGDYAIGLDPGGLLLTDNNFRQKQILARGEGLQNTNILAMTTDRTGNVWLCTGYGIDYAEVSSAYTYLYPDGDLEGAGYTALTKNGTLYLGNSNGLYKREGISEFSAVSGTNGQVYGLSESADDLFMGHHNGAFTIENNRAQPFYQENGTWDFIRLDATHVLAGHYRGMSVFEKVNGAWVKKYDIPGLEESSRILAKDKNNVIWMAHPYRGIYRVVLTPDFKTESVKKYGAADGLPSDNYNHVFKVRGEVVFAGETGIYQFNDRTGQFMPLESYNKFFLKYGRVKMLKEDAKGDVWFTAGETTGRLLVADEGLNIEVDAEIFPELSNQLNRGFEFVYPHDDRNVIFGSEKGFIHLNPEKYAAGDFTFPVFLRRAMLLGAQDSLIWTGVGDRFEAALSSKENTLRFAYGAAAYRNPEALRFQTKMSGINEDWSEWTASSEREFQNLKHGDYLFSVRARNEAGLVSQAKSVAFTINAPWYLTTTAYIFYTCIMAGLLVFLRRSQEQKFEAEKETLQTQFQAQEKKILQRAEASETELERVRREQLETEIDHQNRELAAATLHLLQKREILSSLKSDLNKVTDKMRKEEASVRDVQKIIRRVERDLESDSEWERFAHHFDSVHRGFISRLREKYPNLSSTDLKLCTYLRMNLSSKEIAPLMAILVRGVEAGRYRLRKKTGLTKEENLQEFIMDI